MGLLKLRLLRGLAVAPSELIHSNTETVAGLVMSMAEHSWGGEVVKAHIDISQGANLHQSGHKSTSIRAQIDISIQLEKETIIEMKAEFQEVRDQHRIPNVHSLPCS